MNSSINWKDTYYKSKDRIVLTEAELHIPGLRLFATHKIHNAIVPLKLHYHENAFEFTYIDKGSMVFFSEGKEYQVSAGNIFISYPNETHSTNNLPVTLNEQYWFQLDVSDNKNFLFLTPEVARDFIESLSTIDHLIALSELKQFQSIIKQAFKLALEGRSPYLLAGYFIVLLQMIIHSTELQNPTYPDIEYAVRYIKAHIKEVITLDDLAAKCHLSTSHFKQKFRNTLGISPRNYINQCKIEYAKELLSSGKSITEVSMELGFDTSSYFSSVFKKYTLLSPRDYQKNSCRKQENTNS